MRTGKSKILLSFVIILFLGFNDAMWAQWGGSSNLDGNIFRKGNIGIGTNSPAYKLTLKGASETYFLMSEDGTSAADHLRMQIDVGSGALQRFGRLVGTFGNGFIIGNESASGTLRFGLGAGLSERMRISSTGNVGIGTIAPAARLHVNAAAADPGLQVEIDGSTKLYVTSNGGVSIGSGSTDNPDNGLYVNGQSLVGVEVDGILYQPEAKFQAYGGLNEIGGHFKTMGDGPSAAYGVIGEADGYTYNVGVYAYANGLTTNYSIYADQSTLGTAYAGYFDGDIYVTGSYLPSDEKLKRNISRFSGALEKISALDVKAFEYKRDEYDYMSLPEGTRYGFVAQEFATVFPELTKTAIQPRNQPEEQGGVGQNPDLMEFKAVDYVSLVPVLVAAVQEQQALIEQLVSSLQENGIEVDLELPAGKAAVLPGTGSEIKAAPGNVLETTAKIPVQYFLSQNYPNPFNPQTAIKYTMPQDGPVTIKVYDMLGQEVITLVDGYQSAGYKLVVWDGTNSAGTQVASGTYVYKMSAGNFLTSRKMSLVR